MNFLLEKFKEKDLSSIVIEVKKLDGPQLKYFVKHLFESSVSRPDLSLKYATLARELKSFTISSPISNEIVSFSDELLELLKFDGAGKDNNLQENFTEPEAIFVGYLFNTGFLSSGLLLHWLSNLMVEKHRKVAKTLAKTVIKKVEKDLEEAKQDFVLTSLKTMAEELGAKTQLEEASFDEEKVEEGAWNVSLVDELKQEGCVASNVCEDFRKFLEEVTSDSAASFDYCKFNNAEDHEIFNCAHELVNKAGESCGNAEKLANVVKRSKSMSSSTEKNRSFCQQVEKVVRNEKGLILLANFTELSEVNRIVAMGSFVGELYERKIIKSAMLKSWASKLSEKISFSELVVTSLLLFTWRIVRKLGKSDDVCENLLHAARASIVKTSKGEEGSKSDDEESAEYDDVPFNPEIVRKLSDEMIKPFSANTIELFKLTSDADRRELSKIVFEKVLESKNHWADYSRFCQEALKLKVRLENVNNKIVKSFENEMKMQINSASSEEHLWERAEHFGVFIEALLKVNPKFKQVAQTLFDEVVKFYKLDKRSAKKVLASLGTDAGRNESCRKIVMKIHQTFPWMKESCHNSANSNMMLKQKLKNDCEVGKAEKQISDSSIFTKSIPDFFQLALTHAPQNIVFNFNVYFSDKMFKNLMDTSLSDKNHAEPLASFVLQIQNVYYTCGNFWKKISDKLETVMKTMFAAEPTQWSHIENFGAFMANLCSKNVVSLKTFSFFLTQILHKTNINDRTAAENQFLVSFKQMSAEMKKRDLKAWKNFSELAKSFGANKSQDSSKTDQTSALFRAITNRKQPNIHEIEFDGNKLAELMFENNPDFDWILSFTKTAKKIFKMSENSPKVTQFKSKMKLLSSKIFTEDHKFPSSENSKRCLTFIANLYVSNVFTDADMQEILKDMNSEEISENLQARFKTVISLIKDHVEDKSLLQEEIVKFEAKFGQVSIEEIFSNSVVVPSKNPKFTDIIKKVLTGSVVAKECGEISEEEWVEFIECFIENAIKNPQNSSEFASALRETAKDSKVKRRLAINSIQRRFERNVELNEENLGFIRFIGELFNFEVFTSTIIVKCLQSLEENLEKSSDLLLETISRKVIRNQDSTLMELVRSYVIKSSLAVKSSKQLKYLALEKLLTEQTGDTSETLAEPSKFVQSFCDYLLTKTYYASLEIFIVEGFKTCKESERYQCADIMMKIATLCPEKTPIFAKICKEFGEMFGSLEPMPGHFNKHLKEKLTQHLSSFKSGSEFDAEVKKYGKIFEEQLKYDIEDFECIQTWLKVIFTNSKMKAELAVKLLTKDDNFVAGESAEKYQQMKKKLFEDFPWLNRVLEYNTDSSEEGREIEEIPNENLPKLKFGTIFKPISGHSILNGDIKDYIEAKKLGRNVIFDHRKIRQSSKKNQKSSAKLMLNEVFRDIDNVSHYILLLKEMKWTGWSLGNYLRIMLDEQIEMLEKFAKKPLLEIDWDFESRFGNFLCDLYDVEKIKLVTMNSFLDINLLRLERFEVQIALVTFFAAFEKIFEAMKRRDLKSFESYIKKIEVISIRDDLSNDNLAAVQNLLRRNQPQLNSWRVGTTPTDSHDIPNLIQQIKSGRHAKISLENFSSEDLNEFANCCVEEVAKNPSSKDKILKVVLDFNLMPMSFRSSAHKIFRRELNTAAIKQFGTSFDFDEINERFAVENVAVSEFVASLHQNGALHKHTLQAIFKSIMYPEDYKTLFTSVMRKVEEDFEADKFEEVNQYLIERVEHFRARLKQIEIENDEIVTNIRLEATTNRLKTSTFVQEQPTQAGSLTFQQVPQPETSKTGAVPKRFRQLPPQTVNSLTVNEFQLFLQNLSSHGNDKLIEITDKLKEKSQEELREFALAFFDARKFLKKFSVHVRLAQTIELEIHLSHPEKSFKSALMSIIKEVLLSLPTFEVALGSFKLYQTKSLLSLVGELYNIDWIDSEELLEVFAKFFVEKSWNSIKLSCFLKLLKIVSVKVIRDNCEGSFDDFSQKMKEVRENLIDIHDQLKCDEVLEMFEAIEESPRPETLSKPSKSQEIDLKQLQNLLQNLNLRSSTEISRKLQAKTFKNSNEVIDFAKILIESMLVSNHPEERFAKVAVQIKDEHFKEFLTSAVLDTFVQDSIDAKKVNESLRLSTFVAELFNLDFIDNECINFVLEFLLNNEKSSRECVDCIAVIISCAGQKLEEKNVDKMERYFMFLKFVVENHAGSYRAKIYKELEEKRWKKVDEIRDLEDIWRNIIKNHEEIESYAQLCKEMAARSSSDFSKTITEFIKLQPRDKNVNKILFIAELFKHELIPNEVLRTWIITEELKRLPSGIVTKVISSISSRKNVELDVEITVLLMILEEHIADESEKVFFGLKEDLLELSTIMTQNLQETA